MEQIVLDQRARSLFFVDDEALADTHGLVRRFHPLQKRGNGPVLAETEPWEGQFHGPSAVIQESSGEPWRMWVASDGPKVEGKTSNWIMTVASSTDGERWEKKPLGLFSLPSSEPNHIAAFPGGMAAPGMGSVFLDETETDLSKRYKLIYYRPNYHLAYSADGVNWRPAQADPVWCNGAGDGLEETFFFMRDPLAKEYRGYMRVWRRHQTIRKTSLGTSADLLQWEGPRIVWEAPPEWGFGSQVYGMNVWTDGGVYWALPWVFCGDEPLEEPRRQRMRLKAAWSRDGKIWQAVFPEQDALAPGEAGSFDAGMILSRCPMVDRGEAWWLYYQGCAHRHDASKGIAAVGLAEMRKGGFVSLATETQGMLVTHRFLMRGNELRINARTEPGGEIRAELLSDYGNVIKACTLARHDSFSGDATDVPLSWGGSSNLAFLRGQMLRLRLTLQRAEIFSFRAAGPEALFEAPLEPEPVRCGRCASPPLTDGVLDDTCWEDFNHTGTAMDFVAFDASVTAPVKTRVRFTHDGETLYMAAECDEPEWAKVAEIKGTGPVKYARDETLEIRLSAPEHGLYCHQLMVTADGRLAHNYFSKEAGGGHAIETITWQAAVAMSPGRWTVELAVPFAALKAAPPKAGDRWRLNILRYRNTVERDVSCWLCMFGSNHRTDLAGGLVFSEGAL